MKSLEIIKWCFKFYAVIFFILSDVHCNKTIKVLDIISFLKGSNGFILFLSEEHGPFGFCTSGNYYKVQDWLYDLGKATSKCLDIFAEDPYVSTGGHNPLKPGNLTQFEIMKKFSNFKSSTTRYRRIDIRKKFLFPPIFLKKTNWEHPDNLTKFKEESTIGFRDCLRCLNMLPTVIRIFFS